MAPDIMARRHHDNATSLIMLCTFKILQHRLKTSAHSPFAHVISSMSYFSKTMEESMWQGWLSGPKCTPLANLAAHLNQSVNFCQCETTRPRGLTSI